MLHLSHHHLYAVCFLGGGMMCEAIKTVQQWLNMSWNNCDHTVELSGAEASLSEWENNYSRRLCTLIAHRPLKCRAETERDSDSRWMSMLYTVPEILKMLKSISYCKQATMQCDLVLFLSNLTINSNKAFLSMNRFILHMCCTTNPNKGGRTLNTIKLINVLCAACVQLQAITVLLPNTSHIWRPCGKKWRIWSLNWRINYLKRFLTEILWRVCSNTGPRRHLSAQSEDLLFF